MDQIKTLGSLSLSSRFKRSLDWLCKDVASIHEAQGIEWQPTYFALFNLLHQHGPLLVIKAVQMLNVSNQQSAISNQ